MNKQRDIYTVVDRVPLGRRGISTTVTTPHGTRVHCLRRDVFERALRAASGEVGKAVARAKTQGRADYFARKNITRPQNG